MYRVRLPGGEQLGLSGPEEICTLIASGVIDLDAVAQAEGDPSFSPITQFPRFAKAFEQRFGIGGRPAGSDSTPHSSTNRTPQSPPPAIDDRTLRITSSLAPNDLPPPPPPGPKDSISFRQQELDAWTPISQAPPVPIAGIADDLSMPSLGALPAEEDPHTPITRTAPSLEGLHSGDIEPHTPVTQSAAVILGDPVDDGKTTPSFDLPAAMLADQTPQASDVFPLPKRAISEVVRAIPVRIELRATVPPAPIDALPLPVRTRSPAPLLYALAGWAGLFLVFYGAGIALELGSEESRWIPTGYYWARILLLISAGMGLSTLLLKDDLVGASRFQVSLKWTGAALVLGILAGLASPGQKIGAGLPVAMAMGFLQVVSEEIFFRGYVDRALLRSVPGIAVPTAIAAVMYGTFQLTYGTLWLDRSLPEVLFHAFVAIVIAGVPLSFLHHKTQGFVAPFVFHVALMGVMLAGAR